jgi:hypothetical protein
MGMFDRFKNVVDKARGMAGEMAGKAGGRAEEMAGKAGEMATKAKDRAVDAFDSDREKPGGNPWYHPESRSGDSGESRSRDTFHHESS